MSGAAAIRALVVDDEPLARERLRTLLAREQGVALVGECQNGREALAAVRTLAPDLLLLDVQMPECDGFELLAELPPTSSPAIIFVTAYDRFAVRAFEAHALDYLLKPFERPRFQAALARAREYLEQRRPGEEDARLGALRAALAARPRRLPVKEGGRILLVDPTDIDYVEAEGNYALLHLGRRTLLVRETLQALEQRLEPGAFLRIHRSILVRLDRVVELQPLFQGEYVLTLRDGTALTSGRSFRARLQQALGLAG